MFAAKLALLFEEVPAGVDPDDADDRLVLFAEQLGLDDSTSGSVRAAMYEAVAAQVVHEKPPQVWATAQRLLAMGLERPTVLANLVMAFESHALAALRDHQAVDLGAYVESLDRLPLPPVGEVEAVMVGLTREHQPIDVNELEALALAKLGLRPGEEPDQLLLDQVSDYLMDPDGPLALLVGDRVVEPASLTAGIVLTHRLNASERSIDVLTVALDLVGFARHDGPLRTVAGEELESFSAEDGDVAWAGSDGWLERFEAGVLLAVRVDGGVARLEVLEQEPPLTDALVAALRAVYDEEWLGAEMPVHAEDLLLGLLAGDRHWFDTPQPPLGAICAAAGLEARGAFLGHGEEVWESGRHAAQMMRVMERLEEHDDRLAALRAIEAVEEETAEPVVLREVLRSLGDPRVLDVVADDLLGFDDDQELVAALSAFAERAVAVASRPAEVAVARWLLALVAERRGEPLVGEAHLHLAVEADQSFFPAVDRLAWYRSDRGDAAGAARLWRRLGLASDLNQDLRVIEPFALSSGPKLGRNDPCWCGSGRKYKACHLGQATIAPLPERVGWLCRKAGAYLERRGGRPSVDVFDLAAARAGDGADDEAMARAFHDPIVIDIALHELGWFERFLAERGALLPDDEALLASAWALVDRTVYEIVEATPGSRVEVVDLRIGDRLEVRERTFSREAHAGTLICGRAVPDGETHQFIGGIFSVAPGTESELLDLLDEGDAWELVEYVASLERPPVLTTREGEPVLTCTATVELRDPEAARSVLDRLYRYDEADTWVEVHDLAGADNVIRATLRLDGNRLTIETMSEVRLERVLDAVRTNLPAATVIADRREPLVISDAASADRDSVAGALPMDDPGVRAAVEQWRDEHELAWCDESIPALAGLTPRQAADDPTRRENLERLLASFEALDRRMGNDEAVAMRPARLRQLLGLED